VLIYSLNLTWHESCNRRAGYPKEVPLVREEGKMVESIKTFFGGLLMFVETSILGILLGPIIGLFAILLGLIIIPVGIISAIKEKRER